MSWPVFAKAAEIMNYLKTNLSIIRVAKIDNLDVAISTRAENTTKNYLIDARAPFTIKGAGAAGSNTPITIAGKGVIDNLMIELIYETGAWFEIEIDGVATRYNCSDWCAGQSFVQHTGSNRRNQFILTDGDERRFEKITISSPFLEYIRIKPAHWAMKIDPTIGSVPTQTIAEITLASSSDFMVVPFNVIRFNSSFKINAHNCRNSASGNNSAFTAFGHFLR